MTTSLDMDDVRNDMDHLMGFENLETGSRCPHYDKNYPPVQAFMRVPPIVGTRSISAFGEYFLVRRPPSA